MTIASLLLFSALFLPAPAPETQHQIQRLLADLGFLTSDALAGRLSLSPQADIAARFIAADFQRSGLKPPRGDSYLQEFPLIAYRPDPAGQRLRLIRNGQSREFASDSGFQGSFSRDVLVRAEIVFAGYGITSPEYRYDDYANVDVHGKIALIFDHEPQENDARSIFNGTGHTLHAGRWMKIANARRHGAIAVLIAADSLHHSRAPVSAASPGDRERRSERASAPAQGLDDLDQIPAFSISEPIATEFLDSIHRTPAQVEEAIDGTLKPESALLPRTLAEIRSRNLEQHRGTSLNAVGLLEGGDPILKSETVMITAHYDHLGFQNGAVYPGANDNASGTVAVMELARIFTQDSFRPKRSILFMVFGSEEEQMLGSFYYTAHPLRPLATTRAVLNLDMIGRDEAHISQNEGGLQIPADTTNHLNLVGSFYSPDLRGLVQRENEIVGLVLDTKYDADHTLNALFRCDHLPFLIAHVPAIWFFGGFHPGYHEPSDTVGRLNLAKMAKVIQLARKTASAAADAPMPPRFEDAGSR